MKGLLAIFGFLLRDLWCALMHRGTEDAEQVSVRLWRCRRCGMEFAQ